MNTLDKYAQEAQEAGPSVIHSNGVRYVVWSALLLGLLIAFSMTPLCTSIEHALGIVDKPEVHQILTKCKLAGDCTTTDLGKVPD